MRTGGDEVQENLEGILSHGDLHPALSHCFYLYLSHMVIIYLYTHVSVDGHHCMKRRMSHEAKSKRSVFMLLKSETLGAGA